MSCTWNITWSWRCLQKTLHFVFTSKLKPKEKQEVFIDLKALHTMYRICWRLKLSLMYIFCRKLAFVGLSSSFHGKIPCMILFLIDFPASPFWCFIDSRGIISAQRSDTVNTPFSTNAKCQCVINEGNKRYFHIDSKKMAWNFSLLEIMDFSPSYAVSNSWC